MLPMLAKKYEHGKLAFPHYIQPKFNGIRMLSYHYGKMQSRDEHFWLPEVLPCLHRTLKDIAYPLDGELYHHGLSLQEINSIVAVNRRAAHAKNEIIQYYIFDLIFADESFHRRAQALKELEKSERFDPKFFKFAPTILVHSEREADHYFAKFREQGYEGTMHRCPHSGYGVVERCGNKENRWNVLLKRKQFLDDIAIIVGFNPGEKGSQFENCLGSFQLEFRGVQFSAGSGLTVSQRSEYWHMQEQLLGCKVSFKYEMLSLTGVPLKPIIELVHYVDPIY